MVSFESSGLPQLGMSLFWSLPKQMTQLVIQSKCTCFSRRGCKYSIEYPTQNVPISHVTYLGPLKAMFLYYYLFSWLSVLFQIQWSVVQNLMGQGIKLRTLCLNASYIFLETSWTSSP